MSLPKSFGIALGWPLGPGQVAPVVTLADLGLGPITFIQSMNPGDPVSAITGITSGSALVLAGDAFASGALALAGSDIVVGAAGPLAAGTTTGTFTITETLAGAINSPKANGPFASITVAPDVTPPVFAQLPQVSGVPLEGRTLTCSTGTASGSPSYAFQWQRDGVDISGATAATYVQTVADFAHLLGCIVTASNVAGATVAPLANAARTTLKLPTGWLIVGDSRFDDNNGRTTPANSQEKITLTPSNNVSAFFPAALGNTVRTPLGFDCALGSTTSYNAQFRMTTASIKSDTTLPRNQAYDDEVAGGTTFAPEANFSAHGDPSYAPVDNPANTVLMCIGVNDTNVNAVGGWFTKTLGPRRSLDAQKIILDALTAAGKQIILFTEMPRGGLSVQLEARTTAASQFTAVNTVGFVSADLYNGVGVVDAAGNRLARVASGAGVGQYSEGGPDEGNVAGKFTIGGGANGTYYISYTHYKNVVPIVDHHRVISEWLASSAVEFQASALCGAFANQKFLIGGTGTVYHPGALYNRPNIIFSFDSMGLLSDPAKGTQRIALPGMMSYADGLHQIPAAARKVKNALAPLWNANFPNLPGVLKKTSANNWTIVRSNGSVGPFAVVLPPSMRGKPAETLRLIHASLTDMRIITVSPSGAFSGGGVDAGACSFNPATGEITLKYISGQQPPTNTYIVAQHDWANLLCNGLIEKADATTKIFSGSILTGPAQIFGTLTNLTNSGLAASVVPYGWTLAGTATFNTALASTAAMTAAMVTDTEGANALRVTAKGFCAGAAPNITLTQQILIIHLRGITSAKPLQWEGKLTINTPASGAMFGLVGLGCQWGINVTGRNITLATTPYTAAATSVGASINIGVSTFPLDSTLLHDEGGRIADDLMTPEMPMTGYTVVAGNGIITNQASLVSGAPFDISCDFAGPQRFAQDY